MQKRVNPNVGGIYGKDYFFYPTEINQRIKWLVENGKHIEALFLYAAAIERELDDLINLYDDWAERLLKSKNVNFNAKEYRKTQYSRGMTLGAKYKYLKIYLSDTLLTHKELDRLLESFIKLRNKAIHNLYDHDFSKLEREIEAQSRPILRVLLLLRRQQGAVWKKIQRSISAEKRRKRKAV